MPTQGDPNRGVARDPLEQPAARSPLATTPAPRWLLPLFALVLLLLSAQLALRQTRSEAFPTFLLPAGPSLYRTDTAGIVYRRTQYLAVGPEGQETPVGLGAILADVPGSYRGYIARDNFGFRALGPRAGDFRAGPLRIPAPTGRVTESRLAETRAWLRHRLERAAGHPVSGLRVVKRAYRQRRSDGREETTRVVSDETLPLTPAPSPAP